ncbi:MAG TPA: hypothetical protein EYG95_07070 [Campylobacterales bacterium]|nr:hypothetical protein [Campylobacterales bacterium]
MKNLTDEALLTQLGYTPTSGTQEKLKLIIEKTEGYEDIKKHLLALHDNLKPHDSFVALSSSHDFFKIKNENSSEEAEAYIHKWAEKYRVNLEKVAGKETYYITGQEVKV